MAGWLGIMVMCMCCQVSVARSVTVDMAGYGVKPGGGKNLSGKLQKALTRIRKDYAGDEVTLRFQPGRYEFHPEGSARREYYISNHDQTNPKSVALTIEGWDNVTVDGCGADFIFHGRMLPVAVVGSKHVTLRGFHIDFAVPHISQAEVVGNDSENGMVLRLAPYVDAVVENHGLVTRGEGWRIAPRMGIAFDGESGRVIWNTGDVWCGLDSVVAEPGGLWRAPAWNDARLKPGSVIALRNGERPAPAIFLHGDAGTVIEDVKVHYAEGMGVLAQLCDSVALRGFGVCRRGEDDPRLFTTQADATHFSGCKGLISSVDGLYEGMMDDAINVHGTYLRVTERTDSRTVHARYMHDQSYGFMWGEPGDTVSVVRSRVMEPLEETFVIESIRALDSPARGWEIRFTAELPAEVSEQELFGLENLTWSPEVLFARNVVRNNRARGSLFSTPRRTVVEENLFDHTSGAAILLCGDCMGWFETGACHDVLIRRNRFVNALTSLYQFTEGVISIYPVIYDIDGQRGYFHSGIVIEENSFEMFDAPLLYARSVDGLRFSGNRVTWNHDYKPFHHNRFNFRLERVRNLTIENNVLGTESPSVRID